MMFKATLILALGAVLAHAYVPITVDPRVELDDAWVENALDDLKKMINDAVAAAKAKMAAVGDQLADKAKEVVAQAKQVLNAEFKDLLEELEDIKQRAKALGINISDCVKGKEEYLKSLPAKYGKKITQCGEDKVNEAKAIIMKARASVEASINEVKELGSQWDACGSGWSSTWCKTKVGYEISKASIKIPVNIVEISSETVPLVQTLPIDLEACAVKVGKDFVAEGKQLITDIETCVLNKIKKPTSQKPTTQKPTTQKPQI